jgi:hypothetical protein
VIALALKFLKTKAGLGLALSAAIFVAVGATSVVRYRAGMRDGAAKERAAWSSEVALARASATASQVAADAATSALRDTIAKRDERIAELQEKAALNAGKYREALGWYLAAKAQRDTTVPLTPEQARCDAVVSACSNALAAQMHLTDTTTKQLRAAERLVAKRDSFIAKEPERTTLSNREAMAAQRAAFKAPSRVTWGATGAALGALATWLVFR